MVKKMLFVLAACGHPAPSTSHPAPPPDAARVQPDGGLAVADAAGEDIPALAERSTKMLEALADAIGGTADCPTLAKAAQAVMDQYKDARVAAAAVHDRGDGRALDHALEALHDRIVAATNRMQANVQRCAKDASFAAALTPMDTP